MKKAPAVLATMILSILSVGLSGQLAFAQEPLVGEIRMFAGDFAPRGWAFCNGQEMLVSQNAALFSILGTTYGGDGQTTFRLPDLRGRVVIHAGTGDGLSARPLGQSGGQEAVRLTENQMPRHTHRIAVSSGSSTTTTPIRPPLSKASGAQASASPSSRVTKLSAPIGNAGGSQAHDNMPPFATVNFIIAVEGIYPSRSH
jgi:microcystin-dependent protein